MFKYMQAFDDSGTERVIKLASQQFRDFATNEISILSKLAKERPLGSDGYSPFPFLLDHFQFPVGGGVRIPAMVLALPKPSDLVTLEAVGKAYPTGLDPRDMVWMLNRLLAISKMASDLGIVHGSMYPGNVWISPAHHLAYVDGWHFATAVGSKVRAMNPTAINFLPPEVVGKQKVGVTTDLYSSAYLGRWLMQDKVTNLPLSIPRSISGLLRAAVMGQGQRPYNDAAQLHSEMADTFKQLYGPPKFRPFSLPK